METSTAANQPLIDESAVGSYDEDRPFRRRHRDSTWCFVLNDRQAAIVAAVYSIASLFSNNDSFLNMLGSN